MIVSHVSQKGQYDIRLPKGPCSYMVRTWALKYEYGKSFGLKVYTIHLHRPFEFVMYPRMFTSVGGATQWLDSWNVRGRDFYSMV